MSGENRAVRIALAGNPNCGKTTLFNYCTGANARTANWPGVTVSVESGEYRGDGIRAVLYDLPGIYGLDSRCAEEKGAQEFILSGGVDVIVNVADATALERSLYLTLRLMSLGIPVVMALNMTDVLRSRGGEIDAAELERRLGIPVVESCARRGIGAEEIMRKAAEAGGHPSAPRPVPEKAEDVFALAERIAGACIRRWAGTSRFTEKADGILCRPLTGIPVLILIMAAVFGLTFTLGDSLRGVFDMLISAVIGGAERLTAGADPWVRALLCSAALPAVGAVVSFVSNLFVLYLCLAVLDDSGYMPRAAFMADGLMGRLGLSGKAFLPMILGFGCSVPAILASRIEEGERSRKRLALAIPFIPCGARLPLCVMMAGMFFGEHPAPVCAAVYGLGTAVSFVVLKVTAPRRRDFGNCRNSLNAVVTGRRRNRAGEQLCNCRKSSSDAVPLIMEIPDFRPPGVKSVLSAAWRRVTEYLKKAGSLIFAASVVLHFLTCFGVGGAVSSPADSFVGMAGRLLAPLLSPIGLGFWQIALALICAFGAKEMAVSSLTVLYGTSSVPALRLILTQSGFTWASALSFMVFTVLYIPCVSTVSTVRAEHGWRTALLGVGVSLAVAYGVSFVVYRIAVVL